MSIDSLNVRYADKTFIVEINAEEPHITPASEGDYSEESTTAFHNGEWQFVSATISQVVDGEPDEDNAEVIGSLEYGKVSPDVDINGVMLVLSVIEMGFLGENPTGPLGFWVDGLRYDADGNRWNKPLVYDTRVDPEVNS